MNITRERLLLFCAGSFAALTVLFLLFTSNPEWISPNAKQSFFFSMTLVFAGLSVVSFGGRLVLLHRDPHEAAMALFFGCLTVLIGLFFLLYGVN